MYRFSCFLCLRAGVGRHYFCGDFYFLHIIIYNTMNKHKMKETRVVPMGMVPLTNGEAAQCGQAEDALNVRECENALQVTGAPAAIGNIRSGERLLLVADGRYVTVTGNRVKIDGITVFTAVSAVVSAHAIGGLIVVVTEGGLVYLASSGAGWMVLNPEDAVPQLQFTANSATMRTDIEPYAFVETYTQWRAPLASADTTALARLLNAAWNALNADARADGRHTAPMLVRWAVRLKDGNYLWMSSPQRVGDVTLANADRIAASVITNSNGFIGIQSSTLQMIHYALEIDVLSGIADEWLPLVESIDVLVTQEATLLTTTRSLDYRCLTRTISPREYVLEMGLSRRSAAAIESQLASSPWQLIASAPASNHLTGNDFVAPLEPLTLTRAQCAAVGTMTTLSDIVCSTTAGGRLYCCTGQGDVVVSAPGNALVEQHRRSVLGAKPLAIAVVTWPLYSGGFGRYPVYVFTDDGIYAIPQSATGTLGEARLVDRTVIAADVKSVEAGNDIYFISRHRHLCRLRGAALTMVQRNADYTVLAWCNAHGELWLLPRSGEPLVMMPSGAMSRRSVEAVQLWSDPLHALAVSSDGTVWDLEQEVPIMQSVVWRSHPVALHALMANCVKRVVWHVSGDDVALTLKVVGQRGIMSGNQDVSVMEVAGAVDHPLATAPMLVPARTLRLESSGQAMTGTLILPVLLYSGSHR